MRRCACGRPEFMIVGGDATSATSLCIVCFESAYEPPPSAVVERRFVPTSDGTWMPCPGCGAAESLFLPADLGLGGSSICTHCHVRVPIGTALEA